MARNGFGGPNVNVVRYVFDNLWSVDDLEEYATTYYPGGVPLRTLRLALGYDRVPLHMYAQTLVKFATALVALGHIRSPGLILLEIVLFRSMTPLTQAEVCRGCFFLFKLGISRSNKVRVTIGVIKAK